MTEMKGRIKDMLDEGPIKDMICIYWRSISCNVPSPSQQRNNMSSRRATVTYDIHTNTCY